MTDEGTPPTRKIVGLVPVRQPDVSRLVKGKREAAAPLAIAPAPEAASAEPESPSEPAAPLAIVPALEAASAEPEGQDEVAGPPAVVPAATAKPRAPRPTTTAAARGRARTEPSDSPKRSTSVYLTNAVRSRGTAAFMATQYLEGDTSWSDFVETAILHEAERREKTHNAGEPFVLAHRLSAGRPPRG